MKKVIVDKSGRKLGIVGQKIEGTKYSVGDIVYWKVYTTGNTGVNIICSQEPGKPWVMGWKGVEFEGRYKIVQTIIPASLLTNELLEHFSEGNYYLEEVEVKEGKK